MTGIYEIVNCVNRHRYVGKSTNIEHRFNQHLCELRHGRHHNAHLQNAWNKYGEDNFVFKIILTCDEDSLDAWERFHIRAARFNGKDHCYNIENGGEGPNKVSEETKLKLSKINKGRDNGKMRGRTLSEEWCTNLSLAQPHKHAIICIETQKTYASAHDVMRELGICRSHVVSCCTGNRNSAGGYHWAYLDQYTENKEYFDTFAKNDVPRRCKAPVECIETGEVYETIAEAAEKTGVHRAAICNCCKGKAKTAGKRHWRYVDDTEGVSAMAV